MQKLPDPALVRSKEKDVERPRSDLREIQNEGGVTMDAVLMTESEQKVWQVLSTCRGRSMAILGPEIESITGIPYKRIQFIISGLVCHHGKLIGSGTCGYYIPVNQKEAEDAAWYLRHRAIVALHRASLYQKISIDEVYGQARMEFEKAS